MTYRELELIEIRKLYLDNPDPKGREPPMVDGRIDIGSVPTAILFAAQNRALGAMLEALLSAGKPSARKTSKR